MLLPAKLNVSTLRFARFSSRIGRIQNLETAPAVYSRHTKPTRRSVVALLFVDRKQTNILRPRLDSQCRATPFHYIVVARGHWRQC